MQSQCPNDQVVSRESVTRTVAVDQCSRMLAREQPAGKEDVLMPPHLCGRVQGRN